MELAGEPRGRDSSWASVVRAATDMIYRNKLMRGVILALALLFAAPLAGAAVPFVGVAQAQAQTVSKISVSGNRQVDTATILSVVSVKPGQPSNAAKISQSIDALYKTGLFKT